MSGISQLNADTTRYLPRVYDIGLDRDDCAMYLVHYDDATWRRK